MSVTFSSIWTGDRGWGCSKCPAPPSRAPTDTRPRTPSPAPWLTSAYCSTMALSTSSSPSQSRQLSKSTESQAGCGQREHPLREGAAPRGPTGSPVLAGQGSLCGASAGHSCAGMRTGRLGKGRKGSMSLCVWVLVLTQPVSQDRQRSEDWWRPRGWALWELCVGIPTVPVVPIQGAGWTRELRGAMWGQHVC